MTVAGHNSAGDAAGYPVIAIDGTSGSGKGTVARRLARYFDFFRCDSGALYRSAALFLIHGADGWKDGDGMAQLPSNAHPSNDHPSDNHISDDHMARALDYISGLSPESLADHPALRREEISTMASRVAANPILRSGLSALQRQWALRPPCAKSGLVVDGRDTATVVFSDTPYKIFLDADIKIRAQRRCQELQGRNFPAIYADVLRDMERRDHRDRTRLLAPLRKAAGAFVIDTSHLDPDEVSGRAVECLARRGLTPPDGAGQG